MHATRILPALLLLAACSGGKDDEEPVATSFTTETPGIPDVETSECDSRPSDIPTARGEILGAYYGGKFVFFGGDNGVPQSCISQPDFVGDTWLFERDCGNWRKVTGGDSPKKRGRYAAADNRRGQMFIFGGRFRNEESGPYTLLDDVWKFDIPSETWEQLSSGGGISPRAMAAGAVVKDQFIVYGGTESTDGLSYEPLKKDTWSIDINSGAAIKLDTPGAGPKGRVFHSMTSDRQEKVWLYGGGRENALFDPMIRDLWEFDVATNQWSKIHDGEGMAPDGRLWPNIHFDRDLNALVMFAGHDDQALGTSNPVWIFDLASASWSQVRQGDVIDAGSNGFCDFPADFVSLEEDAPERRYGAGSAYTNDGELLVFGGKTDCGIINDLWTYDTSSDTWIEESPATIGESCQRASASCSTLCF